MILTLGEVLDASALAKARSALAGLPWKDGTETAGGTASKVKRNEQADLTGKTGTALHGQLMKAIESHPVLRAAARPKKFSRLMISRTGEGGGYGAHIDNALMGQGARRLRSDLSLTLFLSDPADYDGGDLIIDQAGSAQSFKLAAGDMVLYPTTSLHQVTPVTRGHRLVCVGWIESMIRDVSQRELLFDLENLRTELRRSLPRQSAELLTLDKTIANLLRMWSDA